MRLRANSDSFPGGINEARAASSAGGGTALTNAAALIQIPNGVSHLTLAAWNWAASCVVTKYALNPYLAILFSNDAFAAAPVDNSNAAQDADTTTNAVFSALKTLANGGAIYIGAGVPFRGMRGVSVGANANAAVLTVKYWNGTAWTDITATDGTASGGKTFAQNGDITWTVPTAWARATLRSILQVLATDTPCKMFVASEVPLYWLRLEVNAVLSATVTLSSLVAMNRSTAYAELLEGDKLQCRISKAIGGIAAVEALTDQGTASLIVNGYTEPGSAF